MPAAGSLAELTAAKNRKLEEQRKVAMEMNALLTDKDTGFLEVSRKTKRDLIIAIDVARRPGFHDYYQPPEQIKTLERNGELKKYTKKLDRVQAQIDTLDAEINAASKPSAAASQAEPPAQMSSLSQWFARYGEPGPAPANYMSTFARDSKIYGGTNHHKAFKSQSTKMKTGTMTR
mmetsp:Transcript_398/g.888  ORF Transcript_398/g.888 Transcript_398/m.888 type:complete len:176 (+) Transcript_398:116-643(+)